MLQSLRGGELHDLRRVRRGEGRADVSAAQAADPIYSFRVNSSLLWRWWQSFCN